MYSQNPKAKRTEFRPPDPTCNPYLTFAALLMAGLDGISRGILPEKHGFGHIDRNIFAMSSAEKQEIKAVPGSLEEALSALERDHAFLLEGGAFTTDLLEHYVELKREQAAEVRLRPSPLEFALYYDARGDEDHVARAETAREKHTYSCAPLSLSDPFLGRPHAVENVSMNIAALPTNVGIPDWCSAAAPALGAG